jgi:ribosomal protein S9
MITIDKYTFVFCFVFFREQVIFPLHLADKLQDVDFEATVEGGGPSGQAGALRLALSLGLKSIVDKATVEKMRLGLYSATLSAM